MQDLIERDLGQEGLNLWKAVLPPEVNDVLKAVPETDNISPTSQVEMLQFRAEEPLGLAIMDPDIGVSRAYIARKGNRINFGVARLDNGQ